MKLRGIAGLAGVLGAGCAHTSESPGTPVCVPPAGLGAICLWRNQLVGAQLDVDLAVDGKNLGQITNDHFVQIDVPAGPHQVSASIRIGNPSVLDVNVADGAPTFLKVTMDPVSAGVVLPTVRPWDANSAQRQIHEDCEPGLHTALGAPAPAALPVGAHQT